MPWYLADVVLFIILGVVGILLVSFLVLASTSSQIRKAEKKGVKRE
jgi:hypothetical protein